MTYYIQVRHKAQKSQINKTYTKCSANVNSDDLIQKPLLEENDNCEVDLVCLKYFINSIYIYIFIVNDFCFCIYDILLSFYHF